MATLQRYSRSRRWCWLITLISQFDAPTGPKGKKGKPKFAMKQQEAATTKRLKKRIAEAAATSDELGRGLPKGAWRACPGLWNWPLLCELALANARWNWKTPPERRCGSIFEACDDARPGSAEPELLESRTMIQITPQMRILVAIEPADFRQGSMAWPGSAKTCSSTIRSTVGYSYFATGRQRR